MFTTRVPTIDLPQKRLAARGDLMELFRAEKCGHLPTSFYRDCRSCNKKMKWKKAVFFEETDETIRMFECKCGERIWDE